MEDGALPIQVTCNVLKSLANRKSTTGHSTIDKEGGSHRLGKLSDYIIFLIIF